MATNKVVTKKTLADDLAVKFGWTKKDAAEAVNPSTGEKITIPASESPKFKASKTFKDAVNK